MLPSTYLWTTKISKKAGKITPDSYASKKSAIPTAVFKNTTDITKDTCTVIIAKSLITTYSSLTSPRVMLSPTTDTNSSILNSILMYMKEN